MGRPRSMTTREHELTHDVKLNRNVRPGSITWQTNCLCGEVFDERRSPNEAIEDMKLHLLDTAPRRERP